MNLIFISSIITVSPSILNADISSLLSLKCTHTHRLTHTQTGTHTHTHTHTITHTLLHTHFLSVKYTTVILWYDSGSYFISKDIHGVPSVYTLKEETADSKFDNNNDIMVQKWKMSIQSLLPRFAQTQTWINPTLHMQNHLWGAIHKINNGLYEKLYQERVKTH